ncbi:MAG: tRNA 2-selenouridine(34) synthase MnmH [Bacteroidota bacterium]
MPKIITAQDLSSLEKLPVLDVRSPGEYQQGHIPSAHSLPLFSDAERAEVGTLYKQQSPDAALLRGLEISGAKMRYYVEHARNLANGQSVLVHCWRGGQRSQSMAWLLEKAGMKVQVLRGGYKAYRQYVRKWLEEKRHQYVVIGGPTGAGKTHVLHQLVELGEYIVDLERLANHKGSAFGALGEQAQPSTEHFENLLQAQLEDIPADSRVWLEDESRMIGTVYLPDPFWKQMQTSLCLDIEVPFTRRVQNLVTDYSQFSRQALQQAFRKITKRLGGQNVKAAIEALENDNYAAAAAIALQYYDKAYARSSTSEKRKRLKVASAQYDSAAIAARLMRAIG